MRTSNHGRTSLLVGTSLLLCTLALALPAAAATLYVDASNASGTEDGTAANPFSAIQSAVTVAASGDTVRVAAGTYVGDVIISGKALRLLGESPTTTTIRGFSSVVLIGGFVSGSNVVEVAGFTITGGTGAGLNFGGSNLSGLAHNCIIVANATGIGAYSGAMVNAYNNVIVGSSFRGVGSQNNSSISISGNIVANNTYGAYAGNGYADDHVYSAISSSYNNYFGNTTLAATTYDARYGSPGYQHIDRANDTTDKNPLFVDANIGDYHLQPSSPCINAGSPLALDNDPDGTRNDQGAYGGPGAAAFWPRPLGGPVVTEVIVTPHDVPAGGTIQVKAKGKVR